LTKPPDSPDSNTTDFGFQQVPISEKAKKVAGIFTQVADKYDVMNDLMSLGIHRLWKRFAFELASVRPGQKVLDLAGGTGDLAKKFAQQVGADGWVTLADINQAMLHKGRDRLIDAGVVGNVGYVQADAERLPFAENSFDVVTMAFGLRNVTNKDQALRAIYHALAPGGKVIILEFSTLTLPALKPLYDLYSFKVLPFLGKLVAGDADSYRYLAESIRKHPNQKTLAAMMTTAGFEQCVYHNLSGGIAAIHKGYKCA
jgi:demethylmenaquinone methyltransferase/2-methoxy-6-polyprenyl-1,4-benzoquinol methylase